MSLLEQRNEFLKQKIKKRKDDFKYFVEEILNWVEFTEEIMIESYITSGVKKDSFCCETHIRDITKKEKEYIIKKINDFKNVRCKKFELGEQAFAKFGNVRYRIVLELIISEF